MMRARARAARARRAAAGSASASPGDRQPASPAHASPPNRRVPALERVGRAESSVAWSSGCEDRLEEPIDRLPDVEVERGHLLAAGSRSLGIERHVVRIRAPRGCRAPGCRSEEVLDVVDVWRHGTVLGMSTPSRRRDSASGYTAPHARASPRRRVSGARAASLPGHRLHAHWSSGCGPIVMIPGGALCRARTVAAPHGLAFHRMRSTRCSWRRGRTIPTR